MSLLTLDIEKPAAGGRMLARHEGQIVLVSGAIPGERVTARIERSAKQVAFAETVEVLSPSPDRRPVGCDPRCGGSVFAHIEYPRQLALKSEIIRDGLGRIGRLPLQSAPAMLGSPEHGYRMRARLHAHGSRLGFYLEGTHQLCDAATTAQLLPETSVWIAAAQAILERGQLAGLTAIEVAENRDGNERACHLELGAGIDAEPFAALHEGLVGLSAQRADGGRIVVLAGTPMVTDTIRAGSGRAMSLRLQRSPRAFFQGNRYLIDALVQQVSGLVREGPVIDLYAGVGLFGLALAAAGAERVTLVEGDPVSGTDLERNAEPFGSRVAVHRRSVEAFLHSAEQSQLQRATIIVDPPRTGLSADAVASLIRVGAPRLVYVSCDVATLARDTRILIDAGYRLEHLTGVDLFPNTAHVESVAAFGR